MAASLYRPAKLSYGLTHRCTFTAEIHSSFPPPPLSGIKQQTINEWSSEVGTQAGLSSLKTLQLLTKTFLEEGELFFDKLFFSLVFSFMSVKQTTACGTDAELLSSSSPPDTLAVMMTERSKGEDCRDLPVQFIL